MARLVLLLAVALIRTVAADDAYVSPDCGGAGQIVFSGINNCYGFEAGKLRVDEIISSSTGESTNGAHVVVYQDGNCGGTYAKILKTGHCYDTSRYESAKVILGSLKRGVDFDA